MAEYGEAYDKSVGRSAKSSEQLPATIKDEPDDFENRNSSLGNAYSAVDASAVFLDVAAKQSRPQFFISWESISDFYTKISARDKKGMGLQVILLSSVFKIDNLVNLYITSSIFLCCV